MDIKEKAMTSFFVTGIDTEIGKTIVTGKIAKYLLSTGVKVTTMKPVQTGCTGIAEDILSLSANSFTRLCPKSSFILLSF